MSAEKFLNKPDIKISVKQTLGLIVRCKLTHFQKMIMFQK